MADGRQRIDKWLFFARVAKSRTLGAKMAIQGRVRVNSEKSTHAADTVKVGDVLTITLERRILILKVVQPGTRRGPAEEARTLYEDLTPAPPEKDDPTVTSAPAHREAGSGRPTKRERRAIDRFLSDD